MAPRPCPVEGRLAVLVSECRIGAPFEKTLGDREVAVPCSLMQCCVIVFLLGRRPMDHYEAAGPWQVLGEGTLEAYIRGVDARLGLEEESDTPFSVVGGGDHQSCATALLLMNEPESRM